MSLLLGCVADDITGATDLANMLVRHGMSTIQFFGVPSADDEVPGVHAIVIALKTRTAPVDQAVGESLQAMRWLREAGARQYFFKYCSTFDSTSEGNIGPIAEAMLEELEADFTIACPAFPENERTVSHGYLFVGDELLSESGMRNHPLTPMTDSNLVRVLRVQSHGPVGLVRFDEIDRGPEVVTASFNKLAAEGVRQAIVDAMTDQHLLTLGEACADLELVTGGSGIAMGLPENFRKAGLLESNVIADELPEVVGAEAVIAGSCSDMTLAQVEYMSARCPSFFMDPLRLGAGDNIVSEAIDWVASNRDESPILIYSSSLPAAVAAVQDRYGTSRIAGFIEDALAQVARALIENGITRLIIAGGETSGAVIKELDVRGIRIGPQIDPGIPWTVTMGRPQLALALKSGNFGTTDFFLKAFRSLA